MHFVMSYSGGKDSALALWRLKCQGHQPVALLATYNPEQERSWFHGIPLGHSGGDSRGHVPAPAALPLPARGL